MIRAITASSRNLLLPLGLALTVVAPPDFAQAQSKAADSAAKDGVKVSASASRAEMTVGESFTITVTANGPAGTQWTFPAKLSEDRFELTAIPPAQGEQLPSGLQRYEAKIFAVANTEIPPLHVSYRLPDGRQGETSTSPITLRITSMLPKDTAEQKLADVRPPVSLPTSAWFWAALALTIGILATVIGLVIKRLRRRAPIIEQPLPLIAADVEALTALQVLRQTGLSEHQNFRPFYITLANIAKRYLERRLDAQVLEMTSSEMYAFLRDHPHGRQHALSMRDVAGAADQVKFARGRGAVEIAERHMDTVRAMVLDIEARIKVNPTQQKLEKSA